MGILGLLPAAGSAIQNTSAIPGALSSIVGAAKNALAGGVTAQPAIPSPQPITLQLGPFVFQEMEVPEAIRYHAAQMLAVKVLVGGARVVDAMGVDYRPIVWSGVIWPTTQFSAAQRAQQLELLRDQAQPLSLTWDRFSYQVYIRSFEPDYRFGRIPYSIALEVVQDNTDPAGGVQNPTIDDAIIGSVNSANAILTAIGSIENLTSSLLAGYTALTSLMGSVTLALYAASPAIASATSASLPASAVSAASAAANSQAAPVNTTLANAVPSAINPIVQAVAAMIAEIQALQTQADALLAAAGAAAGVSVGASTAANVAAVQHLMAANAMQVELLQLGWALAVMQQNLSSINTATRTITVSGGNCYQIAAQQYGDPLGAVLIMRANGLLDPTIAGNVTLMIPPYSAATTDGGVLEA